jgi:LacI family transcriptional regulator
LRVPTDIAVVGVDNDEVFCELADPSLSSVALNAETAGFRAAELLDDMMHGRKRKPRRIVVEALGVVARRSTDIFAVEDEDITAALQFIQKTMGKDISVDDVVSHVNISRRNLERRFREALGCSILEEIHTTRVEQAKRLLRETSYPISQVAHQAGFKTTQYFIQFFQKRVGKTPRRFRLDLAS